MNIFLLITGLPGAEVTAIVNLVTTFMLLIIVATILLPVLSGAVLVVPNTQTNRRISADALGMILTKS